MTECGAESSVSLPDGDSDIYTYLSSMYQEYMVQFCWARSVCFR